MANPLQCVICDFSVTPDEGGDEVLALLGASATETAGKELVVHMEGHTLIDWVRAFKMADAYIEKLEEELELERATVAGQRTDLSRAQAFQTNPIALLPQDHGPHPEAGFEGLVGPTGVPIDQMLTPAEMADYQRRETARRRVLEANPQESLIPFIRPEARPEGVVGRKF